MNALERMETQPGRKWCKPVVLHVPAPLHYHLAHFLTFPSFVLPPLPSPRPSPPSWPCAILQPLHQRCGQPSRSMWEYLRGRYLLPPAGMPFFTPGRQTGSWTDDTTGGVPPFCWINWKLEGWCDQ